MNLDSSMNKLVPLSEEISRLDLYLQIELMRFTDKFEYSITVADDVDPDSVQIPPMLLQPYVENSILHGILPSGRKGRIDIRVEQDEQHHQDYRHAAQELQHTVALPLGARTWDRTRDFASDSTLFAADAPHAPRPAEDLVVVEHAQRGRAAPELEAGGDPEAVLAAFARGLTNKLIHPPTVAIREASADGRADLLEYLKSLYRLD